MKPNWQSALLWGFLVTSVIMWLALGVACLLVNGLAGYGLSFFLIAALGAWLLWRYR